MTALLEYLDLDCSIRVSPVREALSKAGADPEFGKRGGHLAEKQLKTKKKKEKLTTIIVSE